MVLFCFKIIQQVNTRYKMNEIVHKFLLAGYKFMPEMHLRQPGLLTVLVDDLLTTKNTKTIHDIQDIHNIFTGLFRRSVRSNAQKCLDV